MYLPALHEEIHEHRFSVLVLLIRSFSTVSISTIEMGSECEPKYVPTYDIDKIIGGTLTLSHPQHFQRSFSASGAVKH